MSSHDMNEVLLNPEDVVMLQEVAREGEGPEDTLSRVLSECRGEWMKKGRAVGMVEEPERGKSVIETYDLILFLANQLMKTSWMLDSFDEANGERNFQQKQTNWMIVDKLLGFSICGETRTVERKR